MANATDVEIYRLHVWIRRISPMIWRLLLVRSDSIRDRVEEINELSEWLTLDDFDRRTVNRRLKQYAAHDEDWMWQ
jgi:hypothetical protein